MLLGLVLLTAASLLLVVALLVLRVRMTWPLSVLVSLPLFVGLFGIACYGLAHLFLPVVDY